jgi:adenosyl cobinamide kinase/adenosyl cobinamide phosphate guanylyltransferase
MVPPTTPGALTVLLGGARSGKSSLAARMGERHGGEVAYIATSPHIVGDADLDDRIANHRAERPAEWTTIEEQVDLQSAISNAGDAFVIIDCLTLWLNNMIHYGRGDSEIRDASRSALTAIASRTAPSVVITNEVGLGIIPDNELARRYRDELGRLNQSWVAASDQAWLMIAGRALPLIDPDRETT